MPGTLFVVATPIGNLEDITLRAIRVLGEVDLIAAEDTRHTAKLLNHLRIATTTTSLHAHNETRRLPALVRRLVAGQSVALVTDAGTPTVSDPGTRLVSAARDAGVAVVPVPGPSAVLAALSISGFPSDTFRFEGFAPRKPGARRAWLARLAVTDDVVVFLEAPHRVRRTLEDAAAILGDRLILICRELTKKFEESVKSQISSAMSAMSDWRGEFTIVVGPREDTPETALNTELSLDDPLFGQITTTTLGSRRELVRKVAAERGISSKEAYRLIENTKNSGKRQR